MKNINAPTLNVAFNQELAKRAPFGHGEPECEECGCNLTGKNVYRVTYTWCCESCYYLLKDEEKNSRCRDRHVD